VIQVTGSHIELVSNGKTYRAAADALARHGL